ncbi:MAG: Ig-like domain-containing protein, partial [Limisphaerales bacterium]
LGPAGQEYTTTGDLQAFFDQIRRWYGHTPGTLSPADNEVENPTLNPVPKIPDFSEFDLGLTRPTHYQALRIYVPWVDWNKRGSALPADFQVSGAWLTGTGAFEGLDLTQYLDQPGTQTGTVALVGPVTLESNGYVPVAQPLPFTIHFQNDPVSTGYVRDIHIVSRLDEDLDPTSFRFGDMQVGDIQIAVPLNGGVFQRDIDFSLTRGFILRVSAGMDPTLREVSWRIQAIDPLTGEVLQDPQRGLLPPNDAFGAGAGFVTYSVEAGGVATTGSELTASARVIFDTAPPEDSGEVRYRIDASAPVTVLTVTPLADGSDDYRVEWSVTEDAGGSGFKHVTLFVADGTGPYRIWRRWVTEAEGTEVFEGQAGHTYRFLALASDLAGNREQPPFGTGRAEDGTSVNLGNTPSVGSGTAANFGLVPPPATTPSTNPVFTEAEQGIPNAPPLIFPPEFEVILRPFFGESFARGIGGSGAGVAALAMVETPDGHFLVSGGAARNELFRLSNLGGEAFEPLATVSHPIYNLAFDGKGRLWATTGGGPLLQLNPDTGAILSEYGDGLTLGLAVSPDGTRLFVGSGRGIEVFNPDALTEGERFRHYSRDEDLRVASLAFDPEGNLWAVTWPDRREVVRFTVRGRAEVLFEFTSDIDSLAFGRPGTNLEGLLFVSHNGGPGTPSGRLSVDESPLTMLDLATRRRVEVARGGSRGDALLATTDGRLLVSQSGQIDVLSVDRAPLVVATNPPDTGVAALPLTVITVTFDQDMRAGSPAEADSVLNPAHYHLEGATVGVIPIQGVTYDAPSRTAHLAISGLLPDDYELTIRNTLANVRGTLMLNPLKSVFTAISDFSAMVDIVFGSTRSHRLDGTVSFEVQVINRSPYDLRLPFLLALDPRVDRIAFPAGTDGVSEDGRWYIDLSSTLPANGILKSGEATTGMTLTWNNPAAERVEFGMGVWTQPTDNIAPVMDSVPVVTATAGSPYTYTVAAHDPDGVSVVYVLHRGADGMTLDPLTGRLTWSPTHRHLDQSQVVVHVYDLRGGRTEQKFTVQLSGGNHAPVIADLPSVIEGNEGEALVIQVTSTDADGQTLLAWANGLPDGAQFDSRTRQFSWTPGGQAAGTYLDLTFHVSDGWAESMEAVTLWIAPTDQPAVLEPIPDQVVREGDPLRIQLRASDPENDAITYLSENLPAGAALNPVTGGLDWTPGYHQAGTYLLNFKANTGTSTSTQSARIEVLPANGAPVFTDATNWQVEEGQTLVFLLFALDPDNPGYVPPTRLPSGELSPESGSSPTVVHSVEGLPTGADYDIATGRFSWTPGFDQAGRYTLVFQATDDGGGTGRPLSTRVEVPIRVVNANRPPVLAPVENLSVDRGQILEVPFSSTDPDGNPLTWNLDNESPGYPLPSFVTFQVLPDGTAVMRLEPGDGDRGDYPLILSVSDDGDGTGAALTTVRSFVVTVNVANEAPHFVPTPDRVAVVGESFHLTLTVLDPDQEALVLSHSGLPSSMEVTPGVFYGTWDVTWTPEVGDLGPRTLRWTVQDSGNGNPGAKAEDTIEFVLEVRSVNQTPVFSPVPSLTVDEGATLTRSVSASDPDSDALQYRAIGAPKGLTVDPVSGEIRWAPTYRQSGSYSFVVEASDGSAAANTGIQIEVVNTNLAPRIVDMPPRYVREGRFLSFTLEGGDPDEEASVIEAVSPLPAGAKFTLGTRRFEWNPTYDQAGEYEVTFQIRDVWGASESTTVRIVVDNVNRLPLLATSNHSAVLGALLQFQVQGTDPDGDDVLRFRADGLPLGAAFNTLTGEFTWIPGAGQSGDHVIQIHATDGHGTVSEAVLIRAAAEPVLPVIQIELTPGFAVVPNQSVLIHPIASSVGDITKLSVTVNGSALAMDGLGRAVFTPTQPGRYAVIATAQDIDSQIGSAERWLLVKDPTDTTAPTVTLDADLVGAVLDEPTPVFGTVADSNLESWQLSLSRLDGAFTQTLAQGFETTGDDPLASIDPTNLVRGFYRIDLVARDIAGRASRASVIVEISDEATSLGRYTRQEIDQILQGDGSVLELRRLYDAWNSGSGALGIGWSLGHWDPDPQFSLPTGPLERYRVFPALREGTRLYLTLPNGERAGFTFRPESLGLSGVAAYRPVWVPDTGVNFSLTGLPVTLQRAGDGYFELGSGQPYHPGNPWLEGSDFEVRDAQGNTWWIDFERGVRREVHSDGSWLEFADSGVISSDGRGVRYVRDAEGRVVAAEGDSGSEVTYGYDAVGNLISVTSAGGQTSRYGYEPGDGGRLSVVAPAGAAAVAIRHGSNPGTETLAGGLVDVGGAMPSPLAGLQAAVGLPWVAFAVTEGQLRTTLSGSVLVEVVLQGSSGSAAPAVPLVAGATLLGTNEREGRRQAVFALSAPGAFVVHVGSTALENVTATVALVGDLNEDGKVDGLDSDRMDAAQGLVAADPGYLVAADADGDGGIDGQDRALLIRNYGFGPVGPSPPSGSGDLVAIPATGGDPSNRQSLGDASPGGSVGRVGSSGDVRSGDGPDTIPNLAFPTAALPPVAGLRNGNFFFDDPAHPAFGWDVRGTVEVQGGWATLSEDAVRQTALWQFFFVPAWATDLELILDGIVLGNSPGAPADALEVALLDGAAGTPLVGTVPSLSNTDALFNFSGTGTPRMVAEGVTLVPVVETDPNGARRLTISLAGVTPGTLAVLFVDLLGFGPRDATVSVGGVRLLGNPPPVAGNDLAVTDEDQPVEIVVLENDVDSDNAINLASVVVTVPPEHGFIQVNPVTGAITYTPDHDFSGTDSFKYTVADLGGVLSNEATATIEIEPLADVPLLYAGSVEGTQDARLPLKLVVQLSDRDGSESLLVEISGLPTGSLLSGGRQVGDGVFQVSGGEIQGLTWTPPTGYFGTATLQVRAIATEAGNHDTASATAAQETMVTIASAGALVVEEFRVNGGAAQRSTVSVLEIRFSEDVYIGRPDLDVTLAPILPDGTSAERIPVSLDRYDYSATTRTLRIDVHGLVTVDGHYRLTLATEEITSVRSANVSLFDGDFDSSDHRLILGFHGLLADLTGDDSVQRSDLVELTESYRTALGDSGYRPDRDLNGDGRVDRLDYQIWRNHEGQTSDVFKPWVGLTLANDTGRDASDGVTSDPSIVGFAADTGTVRRLEISVDGGPWSSIMDLLEGGRFTLSPEVLAALKGVPMVDGQHTVRLRGEDQHGLGSEVMELGFVLDTAAPSAPSEPDLLAHSDTGVRSDDDVTASNAPVFRVTAEAGAIVRMLLNGVEGAFGIASGPVDLKPSPLALFPGTQIWSATAEDVAGNVSSTSTGLTTVFDPDLPLVTRFGLAAVSDTLPVGDGRTALESVSLAGVTEPGARVQLIQNGSVATADATGAFRFDDVPLAYGANVFTLLVSDAAGNAAAGRTSVTRIGPETDPPVVNAALARDTGRSPSDRLTSDPTIRGAVVDANTVLRFEGRLNDGVFQNLLPYLSNSAFELSTAVLEALRGGTLADGTYVLELVAEDLFGSRSSTFQTTFTLDRSAPDAPATPDLLAESDTGVSDSDNLTFANHLAFWVGASSADLIRLYVDGLATEGTPSAGGYAFLVDGLSEGEHTFQAEAIDAAGNVSARSGPLVVRVDRTAPVVPVSGLAPNSDTGAKGDFLTDTEIVSVTGQSEAGAEITLARSVLPSLVLGSTTASESGSFQLDQVALAGGLNAFLVKARDAAGNSSTATLDIVANVPDTTPPTIQAGLLHDTGWNTTDQVTSDPAVAGTVVDASAIAIFRAGVDFQPVIDVKSQVKDGRFVLTRAHLEMIRGSALADGAHVLRLQAVDSSGNVSEVFELDFTLDATPPQAPANLALAPGDDSGSVAFDGVTNRSNFRLVADAPTGTRVTFYLNGVPAGSAQASSPVAVEIGPLADGAYTVRAQAEDSTGNLSVFSIPFELRIDTTVPTIASLALTPGSDSFPVGDGITNLHIVRLRGVTSPNVRVEVLGTDVSVVADVSGTFEIAGLRLKPGVNTIEVQSTDLAGNTANRTLEVEYRDITGPMLSAVLVNDSGLSNLDRITRDPRVLLKVDDGSNIRDLRIGANDRPLQNRVDRLTGNEWLLTADDLAALLGQETLKDGFITLVAEAMDEAGNASSRFTFSFLLDRVAPVVLKPDLLATSDTGLSATDDITADDTPSLRTNLERGVMVRWYLDGTLHDSRLLATSQEYTFGQLSDGVHAITIEATDVAGNTSERSGALSLEIDTREPDLPVVALDPETDSLPLGDWRTVNDQVALKGVTGAYHVVTLVGANRSVTTGADGGFDLDGIRLETGSNEVTLRITDPAGNSRLTIVTVHGEPGPTVDAFVVPGGGGVSGFGLHDPEVEGVVQGLGGIAVFEAALNPASGRPWVDVRGRLQEDGSFSLDLDSLGRILGAPLKTGSYELHLRARDSRGIQSEEEVVAFDYTSEPSLPVVSEVTPGGGIGRYAYRYQFGSAGLGDFNNGDVSRPGMAEESLTVSGDFPPWSFTRFSIPVATSAEVSGFVTPAGWKVVYSAGDAWVRWEVVAPGSAAGEGVALTFGFDALAGVGLAHAEVRAERAGDTLDVTLPGWAEAPIAPAGFAVTDRYATPADHAMAVDAQRGTLVNDRDAAGNRALTAVEQNLVSQWGVAVSIRADGSFSYGAAPMEGDPGATIETALRGLTVGERVYDGFQYQIEVEGAGRFTGQVLIEVTGVNQAPDAFDDLPSEHAVLNMRTAVRTFVPFGELLRNDIDPDVFDVLSVLRVDESSRFGATVESAAGGFYYDPSLVEALTNLRPGETVVDEVLYTVVDPAGATDKARVYIRIAKSSGAGLILGEDRYQVTEGELLSVPAVRGLLRNDEDLERLPGERGLVLVDVPDTSELGAGLTIAPDGGFRYDARELEVVNKLSLGQLLTDTFQYQARAANGAVAIGTVTITLVGLNDAPTAENHEYTADENLGLFVGVEDGLLAGATDPDLKDVLRISVGDSASESALGATLLISPDGSFRYDPNTSALLNALPEGEELGDDFKFWVTDGVGGFIQKSVTIRVIGRNDAPIARPDTDKKGYQTYVDIPLTVRGPIGLLANDEDPDNGDRPGLLVVVGILETEKGARVSLNADGGFTYDATGSEPLLEAAKEKRDTVDWFTYEMVDSFGLRSSARVSVTVRARDFSYLIDSVATTGEKNPNLNLELSALGWGPSINNLGVIGFQGTVTREDGTKTQNLFVWNPETGLYPLVNEGFVEQFLPTSEGDGPPLHRFSEEVQINDASDLVAYRELRAFALIGVVGMGLPITDLTPVFLTYAEVWNGVPGQSRLPTQLGMGDMGIAGAGIKWGDPEFRDLQLLMLGTGLGGGMLHLALQPILLAESLKPRAWVLNPVWGGKYFSSVSRFGDFAIAYPYVTLNNDGQGAFSVQGSILHDKENFLVTAPHFVLPNGIEQLGAGTPGYLAQPRLSDRIDDQPGWGVTR